MSNPLFDALFAAGEPHAVALDDGVRRYTYADLDAESGRLASALAVAPGDRVAVQAEKSAAGLILYLATVRAGAVFLPLNPAYTMAELAYFIADAEPALIVCDPKRGESTLTIAGAARVETLDGAGQGSLIEAAMSGGGDFPHGPARRERSGGDLLHLGNHGAVQGGHAHPQGPARQRRDAH